LDLMSESRQIAEKYASDFIRTFQPHVDVEQRCEWSCILWLKEYWSARARKSIMDFLESKERSNSSTISPNFNQLSEGQYLNTTALVFSNLFGNRKESCGLKKFHDCPHRDQRRGLLKDGELGNAFMTVIHRAMLSAMLDKYPIDSGLRQNEYDDVYGVDLCDFADLMNSLTDGRFTKLYNAAVSRSKQLAGIPDKRPST
jgi:hypothetical protein